MPDEAYDRHCVTCCEAAPAVGTVSAGARPLSLLKHPARSATFHGVAAGRASSPHQAPGGASPVSTVYSVPRDGSNFRAASDLSRWSSPLVGPASDDIPPRGPGEAAIELEAG
jgi:hypothetical protein